MRRNWLFTILLSVVCFSILINTGCQEPDKPKVTVEPASEVDKLPPEIYFESTTIDFGQVGPGTLCSKELKFHNKGKGTLVIEDIVLCCGVVASTDKLNYAPGETGIIKIEFQAPGEIGIFDRKPVVYTNDPVNEKVTLHLYSEVVQKVVWRPEKFKLYLNEENAGCPKITINCIDEQEFAITGIRSTGNCITADYNPTVKKTEHLLDLKVNMEKLPEQMYGEVSILMNHPEGTLATIFFDVVPKYTVSPKPMYVLKAKPNVAKKEIIKIINNYKEDVEIKSTSSKEQYITLLNSKKDGFDYELEVEVIPPKAEDGAARFTDIFYVDFTNGEQLAINCTGYYE